VTSAKHQSITDLTLLLAFSLFCCFRLKRRKERKRKGSTKDGDLGGKSEKEGFYSLNSGEEIAAFILSVSRDEIRIVGLGSILVS